ncbi:putative sphingosine-1-phosphate lyase [Oryza sativa Japonica Group]|nr:putative sphingosine-1-phosphate lyase [Oryza sativa Japonica Group]
MELAMDFALRLRDAANHHLSRYEPLVLLAAPLLALLAARTLHAAAAAVADRGLRTVLLALAMTAIKLLPGVSAYINAEKRKVVDQLQSGGTSTKSTLRTELPTVGLSNQVINDLETLKARDVNWQGKCSGTVYIAGSESEGHFALINKAYSMFSHTNPLHQDVFKSVAQLEAEVVAMTAALLGIKEKSSGGQICGNMTSGGTESILLAVKTSRDYMRTKKGITKPEMIIAESAHSAYDKAAQYFNIKVRRVPVNKEFLADVKGFKRCINGNTIMMVGSAPGFPHGLIDPIEELGELASRYDICLHVDLCLGGFVLPFARKLGYPIPPFDFCVKGVTSISTDVHKYGLAPKGTSIVLYKNHEIRKISWLSLHNYYSLTDMIMLQNCTKMFKQVTEWTGGLYVSPTIAGSRPGGLIAGAWAAMTSLGLNGYMENTGHIMEVSKKIQRGIEDIPGLFVIGKPDMTVVAFGSDSVDIFEVNDIMSSKGWHLNALQRPNSLHICVTLQHTVIYEEFLKDLKDSVDTVKANPGPISGGRAPIYGAAGKMPDRGMVRELLVEFMDASC